MIRFLLALVLLISPVPALADYSGVPNYYDGLQQNECPQFFPFELTTDREDLITICRINYAVIYDTRCKIPILTFEALVASEIDGEEPRTDVFRVDPGLHREHASTLGDYRGSGYDRGHMVPAGDMMEDNVSMLQTFYLSNVVPQDPGFNRGLWRRLEQYARVVVTSRGEAPTWIVTGAVVNKNPTLIGDSVCVPNEMFKAIVSEYGNVTYIMDNRSGQTGNLVEYIGSLPRIFQFLGITYD
jgi:endonuclease G